MPQFRIVPKRQILIEGQLVSPADVLATIDVCCDLPVDRILNLVEYRNAGLVPVDAVAVAVVEDGENEGGAEDEDLDEVEEIEEDEEAEPSPERQRSDSPQGESVNPFAGSGEFTEAQVASLAAAGVTSINSARDFLAKNGGSFIELDEIGRKTDEKLRAIVAAG